MEEFNHIFKRRYAGRRWLLCHGEYAGVERFATAEAQRLLQRHLGYVLSVARADTSCKQADAHLFISGTARSNALVRELAESGSISIPDKPESYTLACCPSPWREGAKLLVAAGSDPEGALHAVADLGSSELFFNILRRADNNTFLDSCWGTPAALERLAPFARSESPRVAGRGIWSWGYVIADYRRFLDNMARLRMNMITIWNDHPPLNAEEVADYAHSRGIKVVWGFHWGWGIENFDMADPGQVEHLRRCVIEKYEQHYAHLPHDGIYFQTATEMNDTEKGGVPVAKLACDMVNRVGGGLLERHPDLSIQFGLHASSIMENYRCMEALDPRITLTWEDAGVIPHSYSAYTELDSRDGKTPHPLGSVEATIDYSLKLARLRGGKEFALVPKGFTFIRWDTEFENHGPFILGEREAAYARRRLMEKQAAWSHANGLWLANHAQAARYFRAILDAGVQRVLATALVEDGLFEYAIEPAVALFANILWNPYADGAELVRQAHSVYYKEMA